jgi:hypothetical protein
MAPAAAIFTHGADLFGNRRLIAAIEASFAVSSAMTWLAFLEPA